MSTMTDTTRLPELQRAVLRYYTREALGIDNSSSPFAGLTVERLRLGREQLVRSGLLVRDGRGRYRPTAMRDAPPQEER